MMNKAGVPMMAGTDLGNPFVLPGFSLHDELALSVQASLSPKEALKNGGLQSREVPRKCLIA
jgi:hypothetical protein